MILVHLLLVQMLLVHLIIMLSHFWQEFYDFISQVTGVQHFNLSDTWDISDTLFCEVCMTILFCATRVEGISSHPT